MRRATDHSAVGAAVAWNVVGLTGLAGFLGFFPAGRVVGFCGPVEELAGCLGMTRLLQLVTRRSYQTKPPRPCQGAGRLLCLVTDPAGGGRVGVGILDHGARDVKL